jgi:hypothetical protein
MILFISLVPTQHMQHQELINTDMQEERSRDWIMAGHRGRERTKIRKNEGMECFSPFS